VVETADGLFGLSAVVELNEGKAAWLTAFSISRERDISQGADGGEVLSQLRFSDIIRKIPNE